MVHYGNMNFPEGQGTRPSGHEEGSIAQQLDTLERRTQYYKAREVEIIPLITEEAELAIELEAATVHAESVGRRHQRALELYASELSLARLQEKPLPDAPPVAEMAAAFTEAVKAKRAVEEKLDAVRADMQGRDNALRKRFAIPD